MAHTPHNSPEDQIFNANLQEFAHRAVNICNLESNGKLSTHDAYQQIKDLYKSLKRSKKNLRIGSIEDTGADTGNTGHTGDTNPI